MALKAAAKAAAGTAAKAAGRFAPGVNIAIAAVDGAGAVDPADPNASTTKKVTSVITALGSVAAATNIPIVSQVGAAVSTVSSVVGGPLEYYARARRRMARTGRVTLGFRQAPAGPRCRRQDVPEHAMDYKPTAPHDRAAAGRCAFQPVTLPAAHARPGGAHGHGPRPRGLSPRRNSSDALPEFARSSPTRASATGASRVELGDEVLLNLAGYARASSSPSACGVWLQLEPRRAARLYEAIAGEAVGALRGARLELPDDYPVESLRGTPARFLVHIRRPRAR